MKSPGRSMHDAAWTRLAEHLASLLGLDFGAPRALDLRRGFARAAAELGFDSVEACAAALMSKPASPATVQVLVRHLTIAETYFFREQAALRALAEHVLPPLIAARRATRRRLRLWSVACCTGEEAYTLAVLLRGLLPDLAQWDVRIVASDVNEASLQAARAAVYGAWSFRGAPAWLKGACFEPLADGRHRLRDEYRRLVTFETLNLVALPDQPPRLADPPDVVLCRNALMYMTPTQVKRSAAALLRHVAADGWLVLGAAEASLAPRDGCQAVPFDGAMLFRKLPDERLAGTHPAAAKRIDPPPADDARTDAAKQPSIARAEDAGPAAPPAAMAAECARRTRLSADRGRLDDALTWCDRWLAADRLDAAAHYRRATILLEQRALADADAALRRALFLDEGFVMAHVALGHLAAARERPADAERHYRHAQRALLRLTPDAEVAESDGWSADGLSALVQSLLVRARRTPEATA